MKYKIFLIVFLSMITIYLTKKRYYNWDIEAYMGLVYKLDNPKKNMNDIHTAVFSELRKVGPEMFNFDTGKVEETIGENTYYKVISENPKAYGEEIQLFVVKPFYIGLCYLFYILGVPLSFAVCLPSLIGFILTMICIYQFLAEVLKSEWQALVFVVLITFLSPILHTARHTSPDMLSCCLFLVAFYSVYKKENLLLFTIFSILNIFTRPEYIIFYTILFITSWWIWKSDFPRKKMIISYLFLVLSFAIIQLSLTVIPWKILVMNQFLKVQIYPISQSEYFSYLDYMKYVKSKVLLEINKSYFSILTLFMFLIIAVGRLQQPFKNRVVAMYLVIITAVAIRFLIFPSLVERMMVGYYLLIIVMLIWSQKKSISYLAKL